MNWDDIRLFLTIAEEGSFRRAAQRLNLGHVTLSRRIESLEESLDVKIFNRHTTGLSLTEAGKEMLSTATPVADAFDDLKVRLYGRDQLLKGKVTLTLPDYLSTHIILPSLDKFQQLWPDVTIEIITDYKVLNLHSQEADIAIRSTNNPGEQLIGRHLGSMCQAAYASVEYLETTVKNSKPHNWIRPIDSSTFRMEIFDRFSTTKTLTSNLILFDIDSQFKAAELGRGIAKLPCLVGDSSDSLVRISPIYHSIELWLLCHKDLRENKRMRLFREFLVNLFESKKNLISGNKKLSDLSAED